mmetsp:Transcript_8624/g.18752  ORF Transcript_8624/g.18752 Transcript_8624/m.18752 type:complete len:203 (+) Transcript_8624:462-1070(+)|eukprot:4238734-Pleurochrysis_carterae.AAC.9
MQARASEVVCGKVVEFFDPETVIKVGVVLNVHLCFCKRGKGGRFAAQVAVIKCGDCGTERHNRLRRSRVHLKHSCGLAHCLVVPRNGHLMRAGVDQDDLERAQEGAVGPRRAERRIAKRFDQIGVERPALRLQRVLLGGGRPDLRAEVAPRVRVGKHCLTEAAHVAERRTAIARPRIVSAARLGAPDHKLRPASTLLHVQQL